MQNLSGAPGGNASGGQSVNFAKLSRKAALSSTSVALCACDGTAHTSSVNATASELNLVGGWTNRTRSLLSAERPTEAGPECPAVLLDRVRHVLVRRRIEHAHAEEILDGPDELEVRPEWCSHDDTRDR